MAAFWSIERTSKSRENGSEIAMFIFISVTFERLVRYTEGKWMVFHFISRLLLQALNLLQKDIKFSR